MIKTIEAAQRAIDFAQNTIADRLYFDRDRVCAEVQADQKIVATLVAAAEKHVSKEEATARQAYAMVHETKKALVRAKDSENHVSRVFAAGLSSMKECRKVLVSSTGLADQIRAINTPSGTALRRIVDAYLRRLATYRTVVERLEKDFYDCLKESSEEVSVGYARLSEITKMLERRRAAALVKEQEAGEVPRSSQKTEAGPPSYAKILGSSFARAPWRTQTSSSVSDILSDDSDMSW